MATARGSGRPVAPRFFPLLRKFCGRSGLVAPAFGRQISVPRDLGAVLRAPSRPLGQSVLASLGRFGHASREPRASTMTEFQPPPEAIADYVSACLEYVRRALK